ncbi:hypothetical protein Clacol_002285 [Clathrus columnatus]|uniref:Uncharacterized protein n=1 Tax=Clathrus columnatus TaxID=1419009 RepID=A0AAV5A4E8_9AGAM|nr:hypothetical protein Clacol_002285 [Clathrus columnatus]
MSSFSRTSDSQNQTSSLPNASTSNASNGVPQYYFNNFLTNNRDAELFQTTQDSFLSSPSQNNNTAVGSGMINNPTENAASSDSAVSRDLQQFLSAENHAYLSNANPIPSFDGFGLDFLTFIDNNGYNDGTQTFSYPNNDMFFGNQYVPNFDLDSGSTSTGYVSSFQANNSSAGSSSAPSTSQTSADIGTFTDHDLWAAATATEYQSTIRGQAAVQTNVSLDSVAFTSESSVLGSKTDHIDLNADFNQRSSALKQLTSTAGCSAEATTPNAHMPMPSTSKAPYVDWNRTLGQMGERYNGISMGTYVDPTIPTPQNSPPSPTANHTIAHDENVPATSTTSPATTKRRYPKKPLPSETLYTIQNGKYVCQYKGPARPEGCSVKTADVRNLCRHLRNHALKEKKMDIPQEERVACNGLPGESLYLEGDWNGMEGDDFEEMGAGHEMS